TEHPSPGAALGGGGGGPIAGRADARAAERLGGRARSRLQHGVLAQTAARGRALRPDLPQRRRRRRHLLEAPECGLRDRVCGIGSGLAPATPQRPRLPDAAGGLRARRGASPLQAPAPIQRLRSLPLAGADLRPLGPRPPREPQRDLRRPVWESAVPDPLRGALLSLAPAAPHARVECRRAGSRPARSRLACGRHVPADLLDRGRRAARGGHRTGPAHPPPPRSPPPPPLAPPPPPPAPP